MGYIVYGVRKSGEVSGDEGRWISATITANQYEAVKRVRDICLFALHREEQFKIIIDNYFEFECELLKLAERQLIFGTENFNASKPRILLNRRLANLLTACRGYREIHTELMAIVFGKEHDAYTMVKRHLDALGETTEANADFRFVEQLRNYAQHHKMPIHSAALSVHLREIGLPGIEYSVIPDASRNVLLEHGRTGKGIGDLLSDQPDRIDLRKPLRGYMSRLVSLHKEICEIIAEDVSQSTASFRQAEEEYSSINGVPADLVHLALLSENEEIVDQVALVYQMLDYQEELAKENDVASDFTDRSATNAVW
jgi:hypothetical protein